MHKYTINNMKIILPLRIWSLLKNCFCYRVPHYGVFTGIGGGGYTVYVYVH